MKPLQFNQDAISRLQQQANELVGANQFNSIEWQLAQHGKPLDTGAALASHAAPLPESPIYRIYSMTKPIVSFVAVQLIEEGSLALEDHVSRFIPAMARLQVLNKVGELTPLQTPITIAHLLTHTAGFSYDFLPECSLAEKYREAEISSKGDRSLAEVIGMLTALPLASQPGEQWRYSVATDVLAHVLENVTGQALPDLLQQRIFTPLDMQDTAFFVPEDQQHRLLPMFGSRELGQVMVESDEPNTLNPIDVNASYPVAQSGNFYRGGHGLYSTLDDYLKFMHVLQTAQSPAKQSLLTKAAFELLWRNRIKPDLQPLILGYNVMGGYGWNLMGRVMLDPTQSAVKSVTGEGGWAGAASTYFWIDRSNGISGIAMAQYIGSTPHLGALMQHAAYGMFKS